MPTTQPRYDKEQFARRGDVLYENEILPKLTAADIGKFVAIDIETGQYEIAADEMKAGNKLRRSLPESQIWMVQSVTPQREDLGADNYAIIGGNADIGKTTDEGNTGMVFQGRNNRQSRIMSTIQSRVTSLLQFMWAEFGRYGSLLGFIATLAVFLGANRGLLLGREIPIWDGIDFSANMQMLVADYARHGKLLEWNPYYNGGAPDCVDPNTGARSPICIVCGLVFGGSPHGFILYWLTIWFAGGAGIYVLARYLGAPVWGCMVASLGYLFSGIFTGNASHTPIIHAFAGLPWIIWRWDIALRRGSYRVAVESGALWGLFGLAGYPAVTVMTAGLIPVWALARLPQRTNDENPRTIKSHFRFAFLGLLVFTIVGVLCLSSSVLAFTVETKGYSLRSGQLTREVVCESNALAPSAALTFASPGLASTQSYKGTGDLWNETNITSLSIYSGAIVLWLALVALATRPRSYFVWALAAIGALALALAMGRALPLRGWLYDWCPPTRYFRHSAIIRGYFSFAIAVLASIGTAQFQYVTRRTDEIDSEANRRSWACRASVSAIFLSLLALVIVVSFIVTLPIPTEQAHLMKRHWLFVWGGLLMTGFVLLLLSRWRVAMSLTSVFLTCLAVYDIQLGYKLSKDTVSNNDPEAVEVWKKLEARHRPDIDQVSMDRKMCSAGFEIHDDPVPFGTGVENENHNIAYRIPTLFSYSPLANQSHLKYEKNPVLTASALGEKRVFFSPREATAFAHLDNLAFLGLDRVAAAWRKPPMVVHDREVMKQGDVVLPTEQGMAEYMAIAPLKPAVPMEFTLLAYESNRVEFTVEAPEPGYVMLTDRWARGWQAKVNGQDVPVLGGNFIFRAVEVPAGPVQIEMKYRAFGDPWLFFVCVGILAGTLTWSMVATVVPLVRTRRARAKSEGHSLSNT